MKTKGMILAAGLGTRLGELTKDLPKPMLPINNTPLMEYIIKLMVQAGITDIGVNLHHFGEKIVNYFEDGRKFHCNIFYVHENSPSGTAGGFKKLESFLEDSSEIILFYGDIYTNQNLSNLIKLHRKNNPLATIHLHKRKGSNSFIKIDEHNRINKFIERPSKDELKNLQNEKDFWVNSGIYCLSPKIFNLIPNNEVCDFPKDIFPNLIKTNNLYGLPIEGERCAIDSKEKYEQAINLHNRILQEKNI